MNLTRGAEAGGYELAVPADIETWAGLRPYLAAAWAKLLGDLPALAPPDASVSLIIDGRMGGGHVWLYLRGGGTLPAAAADPALATGVYLSVPGVETLVSGADDYEAAVCRLAEEVLAAVSDEPAAAAARTVVAKYPKATVSHDAVDPEHGWYKPFTAKLSDLLKGKRPRVKWTFDVG